MAKGARSKIKRRWRSLRRGHVDELIEKPKLQELNQKLQSTIMGVDYRTTPPKNAFLYPNDPNAVIPKAKPGRIVDLRSTAIPNAGLEYAGARRKKKRDGVEVVADDAEWVEDNDDSDEEEGKGKMKVEIERPKIAKFEKKRKECRRSKKVIVF